MVTQIISTSLRIPSSSARAPISGETSATIARAIAEQYAQMVVACEESPGITSFCRYQGKKVLTTCVMYVELAQSYMYLLQAIWTVINSLFFTNTEFVYHEQLCVAKVIGLWNVGWNVCVGVCVCFWDIVNVSVCRSLFMWICCNCWMHCEECNGVIIASTMG